MVIPRAFLSRFVASVKEREKMSEVGDILATLQISLSYPQRIASIAVSLDIFSTFLAFLANALTHIMYAGGSGEPVKLSLPLVAFQPGRLALEGGYIVLPAEVMYVVCALTTALFTLRGARSSNQWLGMAVAALAGLFSPLVVVHLVNIVLFNANRLLTTSESVEYLFSNPPSGAHYTMAFLSLLIGTVYRGGGQPALTSFLYQAVGASGGLLLLFWARLFFFLFANVGVVVFTMAAIRAVVSLSEGQAVSVARVLLALVIIFISLTSLDFAADAVYDGYKYHVAILQRYSSNPVLRYYIGEYVEQVRSLLPEGRRGEFMEFVSGQPQDSCSDAEACSTLLSQQLASNVIALVLPAISAFLLASEFAQLLYGFTVPAWKSW